MAQVIEIRPHGKNDVFLTLSVQLQRILPVHQQLWYWSDPGIFLKNRRDEPKKIVAFTDIEQAD